jgi:hypothetical protein
MFTSARLHNQPVFSHVRQPRNLMPFRPLMGREWSTNSLDEVKLRRLFGRQVKTSERDSDTVHSNQYGAMQGEQNSSYSTHASTKSNQDGIGSGIQEPIDRVTGEANDAATSPASTPLQCDPESPNLIQSNRSVSSFNSLGHNLSPKE